MILSTLIVGLLGQVPIQKLSSTERNVLIVCSANQLPMIQEILMLPEYEMFVERFEKIGLTIKESDGLVEVYDESLFGIARISSALQLFRKSLEIEPGKETVIQLADVWDSLEHSHSKLDLKYGVSNKKDGFPDQKVSLMVTKRVKIVGPEGQEVWVTLPLRDRVEKSGVTDFPDPSKTVAPTEKEQQELKRKDREIVFVTPGLDVGGLTSMQLKLKFLQRMSDERVAVESELLIALSDLRKRSEQNLAKNGLLGKNLSNLDIVDRDAILSQLESQRPKVSLNPAHWHISDYDEEPRIEFRFISGVSGGVNLYRGHRISIASEYKELEKVIRPL